MRILRTAAVLTAAALSCSISGFAEDRGAVTPLSSVDANESSSSFHLVKVFDAALGRVRTVPPAEAAKIITAYWTPQRRAAAIPVSVTVAPGAAGTPAPADTAAGPMRTIPPMLPQSGISNTAGGNLTNAVGKVYYRDPRDNLDKECTGAIVNSAKRRLVLTAAHCIHAGPGSTWMLNWEFIPGYLGGIEPFGRFPAYIMAVQTPWANDRNYYYDYGFVVTMNNGAGQRLVDAVRAANGLRINQGRPFVTAIGYPSNFLAGQKQSYCQKTLTWPYWNWNYQELDCARKGGASGEPWLLGYNNGVGIIVSNLSFDHSDTEAKEYGPYYNNYAWSLYLLAERASP